MHKLNLVFEGGGIKGIGLVGALSRLAEEPDVQFEGLAGTSAGSMVAALFAAGYTPDELKNLLLATDFSELLDPQRLAPVALWRSYGIHKGDKLYRWIAARLAERNVHTFEDVKHHDLKIIASDLTHKELLTFDRKSSAQVRVADAVRMSISIPIFFRPMTWGTSLVVDGGMLSNYPMWVFTDSEVPTLGLKMVGTAELAPPTAPRSFYHFVRSIVFTMMEAHDKKDLTRLGAETTIHIPTGEIATTQFSLTPQEKQDLYEAGRLAAQQYLAAKGLPKHDPILKDYESLNRLRRAAPDWRETSFVPERVVRRLEVDPPDATFEAEEDLYNESGQDVAEVTRGLVGDAPCEFSALNFAADFIYDGQEHEASIASRSAADRRAHTVTLGFKGRVIGAGQRLKLRWRCTWPGAVALTEDYWVFHLLHYPRLPGSFRAEVRFKQAPADQRLFRVADGLIPVDLRGPTLEKLPDGTPGYSYYFETPSPGDLYLLRWRLGPA